MNTGCKELTRALRRALLAILVLMALGLSSLGDARAEPGYVGLHVQGLSMDMAAALSLPTVDGVLVRDVALDGAANIAGIRHGDLVQSINGKQTPNIKSLVKALSKLQAGEKVSIAGLHEGKPFIWKLSLAPWPQSRQIKKGAFASIPALGLTIAAITPKVRERFPLRWGSVGVIVSLVDETVSGGLDLHRGEVIRRINHEEVWLPKQILKAYRDAKTAGRPLILALVEGPSGFRFVKLPIR